MSTEEDAPPAEDRDQHIARLRAERRKSQLTYDEAIDVLGISRATLYRLLREGHLAKVKIGSRAFIPVEEIRDYWQRQRAAAAKERAAKARSRKPARPRARTRPAQNAA